MGRGDKRTRKGKISRGSYGKSRPRKRNLKVHTGKRAAKGSAK